MSIDYDQAVKILDDLRAATREARECLKDFKQMQREWVQLADNWTDRVNKQIADDVSKGLDNYKIALDEAIEIATGKVFARFDKISALIMGEDKNSKRQHEESIPELVKKKYGKN